MKTTNVDPSELNYDHYSLDKYDVDIVNAIPFHLEIHQGIEEHIKSKFDSKKEYSVLDLGTGTGLTSKVIMGLLPNAKFDVVDFSKNMLDNARKKLGERAKYFCEDYSTMDFKKYDIIVSVISLHHQNDEGKKKMFEKIYSSLNKRGSFIFGDLVTYKDKATAALNNAKHFHYLTEKATDEQTLKDWAYHHTYLNNWTPIEDLISWLKEIGFSVEQKFLQMNTGLLICEKSN